MRQLIRVQVPAWAPLSCTGTGRLCMEPPFVSSGTRKRLQGRLAQSVRAPRLHRGGRRFEPTTAHHSPSCRVHSSGAALAAGPVPGGIMELGVILLVIVVVIAVVGVLIYNGFVTKRNRVDEAVGQIEVQLKRRHDLVPNLVAAVRDYMGFEQEVLTQVTEARANAVAAGAQGTVTRQQVQAENALTRRAALAVRRRGELPAAQGERECPGPAGAADDDGEPDQLLAPALQRHCQRVQHDDPDHPLGPRRRSVRIHEARVLRRGARGRPGPGRLAALTLMRPGSPFR